MARPAGHHQPVKFLLDEMWQPDVADELSRRGYDIHAVSRRRDLREQPDDVIFAVAQTEQRAIVTENLDDFLVLAHDNLARGGSHWGLILTPPSFGRSRRGAVGRLVKALEALIAEAPDQRNLERWLR
jgi:hypothetical protein